MEHTEQPEKTTQATPESTSERKLSSIKQGKCTWEQIYHRKTGYSEFVTLLNGKLMYAPELIINNVKILPISDIKALEKNVVILASKPEPYGDKFKLQHEIKEFIDEWLYVSEKHRSLASLYVVLSWVTDNLSTIGYLRALGDYGTGKTRYLDVIGGICYKPMFMGGAVTPAPIYRIIDKWGGTAIFDEFALGKSDQTQHIVQILNSGYQRNKPVIRCKSSNYDDMDYFDPFGPKIIGSRIRFQDRALESRCITEIMEENSNRPTDITPEFYRERNALQNKLLMYRLENWHTTRPLVDMDFGKVMPRVKQTFLPFGALFNKEPERFKQIVQQFNRDIVVQNSNTILGLITRTYIGLIDMGVKEITAKLVLDHMYVEGYTGKGDVRYVGRKLKELGTTSKPTKVSGVTMRLVTSDKRNIDSLRRRYIVNGK